VRNPTEEACRVSPKAIAVVGLSPIAIAASGCGGDSDPEAEFRSAFEKEFSAAPWYHHITGMEVVDGRLEITTDLGPGNGETAGTICGAAIKFAFDSGAVDEFPTGYVMGSDGVGLSSCA
jgi:hypothetical protein